MQGIHTLVRRRSWLLAAAALAAICALVAIALAPAQAQTTTIPADAALTISLADDSDNVVPADGTTQTVNIGLTYSTTAGEQNSDSPRPFPAGSTEYLWPDGTAVAFDVYGLTLRVSGSLEWDANGRSSLSAAEGAGATTGYGEPSAEETNDAAIKIVTTASPTDGTNEVVCTPTTIDGTTTFRCGFNSTDLTETATAQGMSTGLRDIAVGDFATSTYNEADTRITIPEGVSGEFTISAVAKLKVAGGTDAPTDRTIRGSLKVTVGKVDEVASATLGLAPNPGDPTDSGDDGSWPSTLDGNSSTRLLLQVLNANDRGAAKGSVASILVTTDQATVIGTTLFDNKGTADTTSDDTYCVSSGVATASLACQLPVGTNSNFSASTAGRIIIRVNGPGAGKSAVANVRATILSAAGANITTETVTITFSGKLDKLTISEPTSGLLNTVTPDDNRDRLILSVSGVDASGNNTPPSGGQGTPLIKDSSGRTVAAGSITTDWPRLKDGETTPGTNCANCARDAAGNIQVQINVTAEAANKLAAGDYTIQLRADGKSDTQTFTVSGDVDTVTVSEPEGTLAVNERISVTATVNDADGNAVPDGTTITFAAAQAGTAPVLVKVASDTRTTGGAANATYLVVGTGTGWVNATAGGKSGIQLITVAAAEVAPADPADNLSTTVPGFSSWTGSATGTASELLSSLSGISQILLWQNGWLRYGVADGRVIPGSIDFEIRRGAILWLSR